MFSDESRFTLDFQFHDVNIRHKTGTLPWPALNPASNLIEPVCDMLCRCLHQPPLTTRHQLGVALQDEWNDLNQADLDLLIRSMPRQIRASLAEGDLHNTDRIFTL